MTRIVDGLFHVIKIIAALCLALMIVLVFGNVALRYMGQGISAAEELSGWCLVWTTYFAGLIALRENGHLGFDSFVKALPTWAQRGCLIVAQLLMIALTAIFLIGGWEQTKINLATRASAFDASAGWLYGTSLVFCAIGLYVLLFNLYRSLTGKLRTEELVMVASEGSEALGAAELHPIEPNEIDAPAKRD